ncbi:hypothetical protein [Methylocaldum sp.]|uniref:hypothetical protein n=1 Tax=Methylocaldum sp. TaxID=1969727 RepID=UPI002D3C55A4|nr:hypothetical protein [Methylocaldum sp.]HYE35014.1 hypothetical protein [Methylocaldum sp.]
MNVETLRDIFYKTAFALLFAWVNEASALNIKDDASTFVMHPSNDDKIDYFIDKSSFGMASSGDSFFAASSFSEITSNRYSPLSFTDINTFTLEILARQSSKDWNMSGQEITFSEMQNTPLKAAEIGDHLKGQKGYSYIGYASSAPETETWLMMLVGITLIGLQVIRGDKKTEAIYSSIQ